MAKKAKSNISLQYNGKPVFYLEEYGAWDSGYNSRKTTKGFFVLSDDKTEMVEVPEAVIVQEPPIDTFPDELIRNELKKEKLPIDAVWKIQQYGGFGFSIKDGYDHNSWSPSRTVSYKPMYEDINGNWKDISKEKHDKLSALANHLHNYLRLCDHYYRNDMAIKLNVIGVGKTIDVTSFEKECAKGEASPRYKIGDVVGWTRKSGDKLQGIIKSFKKDGISVTLPDGTLVTAPFEGTVKEKQLGDTGYEKVLPKSILENFDQTVANATLFRSKLKIMKLDSPYLSGKNEQERKVANCPNCQTFLAEEYGYGCHDNKDYKCVQCGQRAFMIAEENDVGTFLMAEKPAKNKFCPDVAKCCDNCALFEFSYGRQGKRCSGYCTFTNQCVVAHNVCPKWMPDEPEKFGATIRQHVTNLGTGVADKGNYDHANKTRIEGEIDDMIYREADHEEQKKKGIAFKGAYGAAYGDFIQKMIEKGKNVPVEEI